MKRALIGLIVCVTAFFAARQITLFFSENISGAGAKISSLATTQSRPVKAQTVVTSLPPLTNLSFRAQRPASPKPNSTPSPQPETPEPTAPEQTNEEAPSTQTAAATSAASASTNPNRRDPMARVALSMVGIDSAAEEYWAAAINDPTLSDKEREDLIEDLNEVGFADPRNPTQDELPLIINRLQIIEEYAPFAMDDNNARSFAEAYKDLSNMLARLTAQ